MRTALILMLAVFSISRPASGQATAPALPPAALLRLSETTRSHEIGVHVTVDGLTYDQYWAQTIDAIFSYADTNADGGLSEDELRLVPSARAIRLSLGTGFTPPVMALQSVREIVSGETAKCSNDDLRNYYRRHGVGQLTVGYARLPNTVAISDAIVKAVDEDRDGLLSEAEFQRAEMAVRRLDANDDELIGVGELLPNGTYPGNWAANPLRQSAEIDLSVTGDRSLVLKREAAARQSGVGAASDRTAWQIAISEQVQDQPLQVATKARCESWSVPGPLNGLFRQLREELATPTADASGGPARDPRSSRAGLTPLVDRDGNGEASPQEVERWLELQGQLIRGHLLLSVYYGGGLFELLDTNHDAGLSIRELRSAWQTLKAASCPSDDQVDVRQIPNVLLFVISQGYPASLAKSSTSELEWFRRMDRNADGDVSRREFTGSPDAFGRLDKDRDGLISSSEAAVAN